MIELYELPVEILVRIFRNFRNASSLEQGKISALCKLFKEIMDMHVYSFQIIPFISVHDFLRNHPRYDCDAHEESFFVHAVTYNFLRIRHGLGGLA